MNLTVTEGCETADAVAEEISSQVSSLLSDIENTFGISWSALISDFIAQMVQATSQKKL